MAVTGGIKFFEQNKALVKLGATVEVTSGDMVAEYMLDTNPITAWNSVGSSDAVTETIIIRFGYERDIDRLLLVDHNFEQFTASYWNGSGWTNFASVRDINGNSSLGITEISNTKTVNYYEFDQVTTTAIRIQVVTTLVTNDEKYIFQVIATKELGTLQGYPIISNIKHSRSSQVTEMLSGKSNIIKSYESFSCKLQFKNYPASLDDDIDLIYTLFDSIDPFIMWLCGGKYGSTRFANTLRGFRLKDLYQCQTRGELPVSYYKNIYTAPVNLEVSIDEVV